MGEKTRLGISACLLGENVRYDGGHKRDHFLTDILGRHVEFLPVCPEVECGFDTPREPFHLAGDPRVPRLITVETQTDYTQKMSAWARQRAGGLEKENLCGFIFKSDSPSCGMQHVEVFDKGMPIRNGVGLFARAFMDRFPLVLVEDDRRLNDPKLRENFIEQILTLKW